ncbi:hypothetical protein PROFUN_11258 [Planoprotostelium fungivorum]|uniref:Rhodopsin n=1 Tax=Planoprotostelium fungivorum TaxID=1890364 RepID=A0A2P6NAG6_9EUKA|nr:hypothetical protein PROFUN_11258 [Planoprotostelium fungivorum]
MVFRQHNNLTEVGDHFLWGGIATMACFSLIFFLQSARATHALVRGYALKHAIACVIAALSYFLMSHQVGMFRKDTGRAWFYLRYLEYAITTPLLMYDFANLSQAGTFTSGLVLLLTEGIVLATFYAGSLQDRTFMWRIFAGICFAGVFLAYLILVECRPANKAWTGLTNAKGVLFIAMFIVYALGWGLSEGGQLIPVDFTHLWFVIADNIARCFLGALFIWITHNVMQEIDTKGK